MAIDPFSMIMLPVMINIVTSPIDARSLFRRFQKQTKPINHDLQKAIKIAYLQALIEIATEFKAEKIQSFRLYLPTEIDQKIEQWQTELQQVKNAKDETEIASPLQNTAEIEQLLLSHGQPIGEQIKELETRLISQALQGIVNIPTDYQDQIKTGLFARIYAHFIEQLKINERAYRAFELEYLPAINASLTEIGVGQEQVALTMTDMFSNVWEADKNAFSGFDVFRNLEFNPEQVRDYISRWFAGIGDAATGESLEEALALSENSRLKELILNPLRLWMLCQIQILQEEDRRLPETQADLYKKFVDWVYRWKADEEILDQREVIDTALARLALAAMEQKDEVSRLRLRESWVVEVLGSRPIFQAVMKLGWLNRVERFPEAICVFYHATFQEYFAALAVEDWDYFLPRNHVNFPMAAKEYRIFEPQWKQMILLWLGREDVVDEEKEGFIRALVEFEDGFTELEHHNGRGFYEYQSYFLAAAAINEFKACSLAGEIVRQVVKWGFGYFNTEKQDWRTFLDPIKKGAREAIPETIQQLATTELIQIIENCQDEDTRKQVADSLGKIDPGNPQAIAAFIRVLETTDDEDTRRLAAESLGKIDPGNPQAIAALIRILETTDHEITRLQAADSLGKIGQGNPQAIAGLIRVLETTDHENTRWLAAYSLGKIDPGNPQAIAALIRILETTDYYKYSLLQAAESFEKIGQGNPQAIAGLIRVLETNDHEITRWRAAESLGKILTTPQQYAGVVSVLKYNLSDEVCQNNFYQFDKCYQLMWNCAANLPYPDFYQAWHNPPTTPHPEVEDTTPVASTPFTQYCNLALLPQSINQAIQSSSHPPNRQIICIDGSRFSDPSNPALQIYTALKQAGCPAINDRPRTIAELQAYCEDDLSAEKIALILYEAPTDPPPQEFDIAVLNQLARFSHPPIAVVVGDRLPECRLSHFLETAPDLIANILQWLHNLER